MKAISITLASTLALTLASCSGHRGPSVPDMRYTKDEAPQTPAVTALTNGEPQTISDDQLLPPINGITPTVTNNVAPTPTPSPSPTPSYGSALIPSSPAVSSSTPASTTGYAPIPQQMPSATPSPVAAAPAPTSSIPVAARVEGDPMRVYNPWNPSQRILIKNPKTNQPFPSGKVLGIPNSDKKFIVP